MSQTTNETDHAMLVLWGMFAHCIGLIQGIEEVPLSQKTVTHSPQSKVLEFLVAMLSGHEYLKDISQSARPLDKDMAVAQAWGQKAWADHSGVSRTLGQLSELEVEQISRVLEQVSQPFIDQEVHQALAGDSLILDGDLTPRAVSNGSKSYPGAEYGHMSDRLQLGYQAAIVSLKSPTYGRVGLSAQQHSGKTVSATQAEALALEAERCMGRRPLRRTDLLAERIQQLQSDEQPLLQKIGDAEQRLLAAQTAQTEVAELLQQAQQNLADQQTVYAERQKVERPHSKLAKVRKKVSVYEQRLARREKAALKAIEQLERQKSHFDDWKSSVEPLQRRLQRFESENAANPAPIEATFRLDAGFGTPENLALLIEMGYEVYSKPYGTWLSGVLAKKSANQANWEKVGNNAVMQAWKAEQLEDFPYPLDLGYERFWIGKGYRFSGLLHFGKQEVTADLPAWFHQYNARQIIEAGNKEARQVFEVHHLKVRSRPALRLQEHFALFAANFVRFASAWLTEQCPQIPNGWKNTAQPNVKEQVKVGAHTPAQVEWIDQDCLLRFADRSIYAGRSFFVRRQFAIQLALPWKFSLFEAF